jgi:hypothetical protein
MKLGFRSERRGYYHIFPCHYVVGERIKNTSNAVKRGSYYETFNHTYFLLINISFLSV